MAKRSIVPFGPQHPVLPEPVHLDLVLEDETVVEAIPSIGFIHRGLEKLVETGRLPMNELAAGSGTDKKTMERHRKYLVAILLAFTNGYEIIRGHLCQIAPAKGGQGR